MLTLSIIKLASLVSASLAVAAAVSIDDSGRSVTSVEFEGHTVNYYTDAFIIGHDSPARMLHKRDNDCGNSDFEPAPPRRYSFHNKHAMLYSDTAIFSLRIRL